MKADLYNQSAKKIGEVDLNDDFFSGKVNHKVLSQYVYIYLSNQRQGNANTKDRSEVSGGGRKPWRQKGTGNARVGSNRSPIWRGGGVTHGPTSDVNWSKKTTKSFRRSAMQNAFSKINTEGLLKFIDKVEFNSEGSLTKQAVEVLNSFGNPKKFTIVSGTKDSVLVNSFSNLKNAKVIVVNELNAYDILNAGTMIVDSKALEVINNNWVK